MKIVTLLVFIIVCVASYFLVIKPISDRIDADDTYSEMTKQMTKIMPVFILFVMVFATIGFFSDDELVDEEEEAYYLEPDDIAIEPGTLKVRDAKKILKIRYAKGDISSLEYSERMSRL